MLVALMHACGQFLKTLCDGWGRAGQGRAGQGRAGQGRAGQGSAGGGWVGDADSKDVAEIEDKT